MREVAVLPLAGLAEGRGLPIIELNLEFLCERQEIQRGGTSRHPSDATWRRAVTRRSGAYLGRGVESRDADSRRGG